MSCQKNPFTKFDLSMKQFHTSNSDVLVLFSASASASASSFMSPSASSSASHIMVQECKSTDGRRKARVDSTAAKSHEFKFGRERGGGSARERTRADRGGPGKECKQQQQQQQH